MKIRELKKMLEQYDDNAEFMCAVSDHAEIINFHDFGQDAEYEEQALCLTLSLPDNYYLEHDIED